MENYTRRETVHSVFSHIVQKRFSQVNEDVATDALAYILDSSESARIGMMKLFHSIAPELPALRFKTQQADGTIRPDLWGFAENQPRVFVENKFWAGLTDNQPVAYLRKLAFYRQPSILLVVAPALREQTLWRELNHRLQADGIAKKARVATAAVPWSVDTEIGPILALTSWTKVLSVLEHECSDDPHARGDLVQLRALCASTEADAFVPMSRAETSDQRAPSFVLQLSAIIQSVVGLAVSEQTLCVDRLRPQASWERIGRYARVSAKANAGAGAWLGIHFGLWKAHGITPLWLVFENGTFGRGHEVRELIEPWAEQNCVLTSCSNQGIAIALEIPQGEEKDAVVRSLVNDLKAVAAVLQGLPSQPQHGQVDGDTFDTSS